MNDRLTGNYDCAPDAAEDEMAGTAAKDSRDTGLRGREGAQQAETVCPRMKNGEAPPSMGAAGDIFENGKSCFAYGMCDTSIFPRGECIWQKQLVKALHTSREILFLAAELACLASWEYHPEKGQFELNDQFYAIFATDVAREGRYMSPEVYVRNFVHPDDVLMLEEEIMKILLSQERIITHELKHRIIRRDGAERTVIVRSKIIRDAAGGIIRWLGATQDITEQKTMKEALLATGEKFALAAELARLGPWEYHQDTDLFEFDDEFYAIYGTNMAREGRFMHKQVYRREFVHPDDMPLLEAVRTKIYSSTERCQTLELKHRIIRRDGEERTVMVRVKISRDAAGRIVRWFGVNQDITEQVQTEEALRHHRETFALAAELTHLGPWRYHPETKLYEFGDEFYAVYGTDVSREGSFMSPEVYTKEFVHPDDAWMIAAAIESPPSATGCHTLEHRIIRRDGAVRTIIVQTCVARDDAGKVIKVYGANQDITERKATEEALRGSKELLSLAVELARLGPWKVNLEHNMFEFNDDFYAIYGTDTAREGRLMDPEVYFREFVHPEDVWIVEAEGKKAFASTGRNYLGRIKHRIIRRDGAVRTIMVHARVIRDETGRIVRWFGANQDITEQVKAEQALRESELRHKATLQALPDMLFRVDTAGNMLDYHIPDQYWPYFGETTENCRLLDDILPAPLVNQAKEMVMATVGTGEAGITEYCGQINGRECFLQIRTAAINEQEALVIIQDQTELYRIRRECQRLERLNLVGSMAAGIGHEVRNPLTTVRGYLQLLSDKERFKDFTEMFSLLIGELDRTNAIISEFLALSKNKTVKLEPRNINKIIRTIYPLLAVDALEEDKTIILELDEEIPLLDLDESEIRQLVINFVRNGLEATADKGEVTIKTQRRAQHVILSIRDNGSGIPASVIEQIGTPFVSTKDHGTGLGLSVCYSIAARHRAKIDFLSNAQGTEFTVCFLSA